MIVENKEFDIFVGSRIGSFKHIKYNLDPEKNTKKSIENIVDIKTLEKDESITCMAWANKEQTDILLGRKNQQVQIYNTELDKFTKTLSADYAPGHIVGLGRIGRKVVTAVESGIVKIWSKKAEQLIQTGGMLDAIRVSEENKLIATGGKENDLKIYKLGEDKPLFQAKNLPNDWLELRQPVWVTDLCFLTEDGAVLATCSRYGYVRLYDTRAQRRPVCNVQFEKMAATCITPSFDDNQVIVGFGRGQLHQVDLRGKGKPDKGFKGAVGAVTSVALHRPSRSVVSVSLDRYCRIHDFESKDLKYKQYLTSKLSTVLVQSDATTPLRNAPEVKEEAEVKQEDEFDVLFDKMETVGPKPDIKPPKRKTDTDSDQEETEDRIKQLLKSTEKKKKKIEKKKKDKKNKSVFHNA